MTTVMILRTAEDAARLVSPFFESGSGERVVSLFLDADQRLLAIGIEPQADDDEADLPVRRILAHGLCVGARALILCHNHPSGDSSPSEADRAATRQLAAAGAGVGIRLFDHLILAGRRWSSFRALGLL